MNDAEARRVAVVAGDEALHALVVAALHLDLARSADQRRADQLAHLFAKREARLRGVVERGGAVRGSRPRQWTERVVAIFVDAAIDDEALARRGQFEGKAAGMRPVRQLGRQIGRASCRARVEVWGE